jgi:hypothetical protein
MTDCCSPGTGFPTSDQMDQLSLNQPIIWQEISAIQQAILAASSQCQVGGGQFCTIVAGTTPMTFVAGVTSVSIINGGSGYYNDYPTVQFIPPNGSSATGAVGTVVTNGGKVLSINITAGGSGYAPIPATISVTSTGGTGASIQPFVNAAGQLTSVAILNPGTGYSLSDTVVAHRAVVANSAYVNAVLTITSVGTQGQILAVAVTTVGTGYQNSVTTCQIVSTLSPSTVYPLGAGFAGTVLTNNMGAVTSVVINNGGVGYSVYPPYLVISNPGYGAITQVGLTATTVTSITVLSGGTDYVPTPTGTIFNPATAGVPNPPGNPAVVTINYNQNTAATDPNAYYQVFAGTATSKQLSMQMNTVLQYFQCLGYTITRQTNPATGNTMQWKVCW